VAVLPVAGLLLGIGAAHFDWIPPLVSSLMKASGDVVFGNLPLIFAVGVAVGLTENDGIAAISAVVDYVVLLAILGVMAGGWCTATSTASSPAIPRRGSWPGPSSSRCSACPRPPSPCGTPPARRTGSRSAAS